MYNSVYIFVQYNTGPERRRRWLRLHFALLKYKSCSLWNRKAREKQTNVILQISLTSFYHHTFNDQENTDWIGYDGLCECDEQWLYNRAEIYSGKNCAVTLRKTVQHWKLAGHGALHWSRDVRPGQSSGPHWLVWRQPGSDWRRQEPV